LRDRGRHAATLPDSPTATSAARLAFDAGRHRKESVMTGFRFFMIVVIFTMVSIAWAILGGTVYVRTENQREDLSPEVDARWGPAGLVQPALSFNTKKLVKAFSGKGNQSSAIFHPFAQN